MKDKEFLQWVHDRLQYQHDENPNFDYMHKLRAIIDCYDRYKHTANITSVSDRSPTHEHFNIVSELPQEPETFVPVVGEECEYNEEPYGVEPSYGKVTPISIIDSRVYFFFNSMDLQTNGGRAIFSNDKNEEFRPIKTEREKVIEWAMSTITIVNEDAIKALKVELGSLYDLGALKIPENEQ